VQWWETLLGIAAGLLAVYAMLLLGLWFYARSHPETVGRRVALRLLPDVLRFLRRLAADPSVSRRARVKLYLLLGYLILPLDLVPDFLPLIGYADDVIIIALVLRSVVRSAGPDALRRHWPGTPAGLAVVERLAGLPAPTPEDPR
jgi:uncharacterized membrane protein YkvA (DUF1232 family)